jgi:2-polyprenyl-3-methyl-5-hydroxy-6-metoxy-1,4-benzoquinol methylase
MKPDDYRQVWESLGAIDPDWAVLTDRDKRHGGWESNLAAFYKTGERMVATLLDLLPTSITRGSALDWGSGTGRLTFALARRYERVTGVDVSAAMLRLARRRAEELGITNVTFAHSDDHVAARDYDLVLSARVLQHLPDATTVKETLSRMVKALADDGWLVVEIPTRARTIRASVQPRLRAYAILRRLGLRPSILHRCGLSGISMLTVSPVHVHAWLAEHGLVVVEQRAHVERGYEYGRYAARRMADTG